MSEKPFKSVAAEDRRDPRFSVRMTHSERSELNDLARMHNLHPGEFARRKIFGRRLDARLETEMILEVREAVAEIKALHATYKASGNPPPETLLAPVLQNAILAIQSLGRY